MQVDIKNNAQRRFAWIEINLDNLSRNLKIIKSSLSSSDTKIMAVVKADAYGHGAIEISKHALNEGVYGLGVALVNEGIALRKAKINSPIYVFGEPSYSVLDDALANDLILTVNSYKTAKEISTKCSYLGKRIKIHINTDTGMNRIGINFRGAVSEIIKIESLPNLEVEGVFTHFSCASKEDDEYTRIQWERFNKIIKELSINKIKAKFFHCSNSAAFFRYKDMHFNMVRIGIAMYGLSPFESKEKAFLGKEIKKTLLNLKPVLNLKAKISFIKDLPEGECISYCCSFKTKRRSIIATIPVGYADGYPRLLSNKSKVLICGNYAPVVGNITMDQLMIDITDIASKKNVSIGDEVILIGEYDDKKISADELAEIIGTINYEIVCMLKERLPKIYVK